jgi:hypothetical protein
VEGGGVAHQEDEAQQLELLRRDRPEHRHVSLQTEQPFYNLNIRNS